MFGVWSYNDAATGNSKNHKLTTFPIANRDLYKYPFQTSNEKLNEAPFGTSFYHKDDFSNQDKRITAEGTSNWYYVYNYGFKIVQWKLSAIVNGVKMGISLADYDLQSYDVEP